MMPADADQPGSAAGSTDHAAIRRALGRIELTVNQRLTGRNYGDYLGIYPGPGSEAGDSRLYVPGDDIRLIDWNITARTNQAHIRTPIRDHELTVWLVIDTSASLAVGSRGGEKSELAILAAAAFAFTAGRLANPVAAILADRHSIEVTALRTGTKHVRALLFRALEAAHDHPVDRRGRPLRPAGVTDAPGGLAAGLERCARLAVHPGFVAVISDFLVADGWQDQLHRLAQRHTTVVVDVVDPLDVALPPGATVMVQNPETGATMQVTPGATLRRRYAAAASGRRAAVVAAARHAGADHVRVDTDGDWIGQIVGFLHQQRARHSGYRRASWTA